MSNTNEKIVQVPLTPKVKAALEARADQNGRATGREAQHIITRVLNRKQS